MSVPNYHNVGKPRTYPQKKKRRNKKEETKRGSGEKTSWRMKDSDWPLTVTINSKGIVIPLK